MSNTNFMLLSEIPINIIPVLKLKDIPGLIDLSWGETFSGRGQGYTHCLVSRFENTETLPFYQKHELHEDLLKVVKPLMNGPAIASM